MQSAGWERTKRIVDLVAGLSVIATMVFIALQWNVMQSGSADTHNLAVAAKDQAEATKNSVVANNRSWIEMRMAPPLDKGDFRKQLAKIKTLDFDLTFANVGKVPARTIAMDMGVEVLDNLQPAALNFGSFHYSVTSNILFPGRESRTAAILYAPGAKVNDPSNAAVVISPALRRELENGTKYIVVYSQVTFADNFGNHWLRYCGWLTFSYKPNTYASKNCVDYNGTGDMP